MSSSLLLTRRFAPLFWCQFFSAFSDNFLKNALVFLLVYALAGPEADALTQLAAAIFIAPYFFLSALGGEIADRFDKARVAQRLKLAEIAVAVIAVIGFAVHSVLILFIALFLYGVIGSLFGPDQIRHPARPSRPLRAADRQRAGGRRDLHRDPARPDRRRHGGERRRRPDLVRAPDDRVFARLLGLEPAHPADRRGGARSGDTLEHRGLDLRPAQASARRPSHLVGRHGDQLVLAGRRGRGRIAGAAGQECAGRFRGGGRDLPCGLLGLDRDRLGTGGLAGRRAHHSVADADRRRPDRPVLDRSRMVDRPGPRRSRT